MQCVTDGAPKELLKLGHRTVIDRIVDEAWEGDPDAVIVINSPGKPGIDEWAAGRNAINVAYQLEPKGLADAIASAEVIEDALILLGDAVFRGGSPIARIATLLHRGIAGCVAVEPVSDDQMHLYGIAEINEMNGTITRILEKPRPSETKSRWAVAARYGFIAPLMASLADFCLDPERRAKSGEMSLTEFLNMSIKSGADIRAVPLQSGQQRVDCGSPEEYARAIRQQWD